MNNTLLGAIILLFILAGLALFYGFSREEKIEIGAAPSGLAATQQSATTTTIGPQENIQLFASNRTCSSRVVGTRAAVVLIIFADPSNNDISSTTLSGSIGFWQGASTTVAYDSGLYGCGRVFGYAYSSTTVTIAEF